MQPVAPNEDEEFEFRARAEQEARQHQAESGGTPNISSAQQAEDAANKPLTPGQALVGGAQVAYEIGKEHPLVTGAAALGAGKLLGNIPGVAPAANAVGRAVIPGYNLASGAVNAANQFVQGYGERNAISSFNTLLNNYTKMQNDVRQYVKAGQQVPQELNSAMKNLGQQIEAAQSKIPGVGSAASNVAQGAATAAEQPGMISKMGQLAGRYAPMIGKLGGVGAQALLHSGGLNANEDEELKRRRALSSMQGNPVNQQGMNALNSGFSQQLNTLST